MSQTRPAWMRGFVATLSALTMTLTLTAVDAGLLDTDQRQWGTAAEARPTSTGVIKLSVKGRKPTNARIAVTLRSSSRFNYAARTTAGKKRMELSTTRARYNRSARLPARTYRISYPTFTLRGHTYQVKPVRASQKSRVTVRRKRTTTVQVRVVEVPRTLERPHPTPTPTPEPEYVLPPSPAPGPFVDPEALGVFFDRVRNAATEPVPVVYAGSSTTAAPTLPLGTGYAWRIHDALQRTYPNGAEESTMQWRRDAAFTRNDVSGIHGYNLGHGSTSTATYFTPAERTAVAALEPALVLHMASANDWRRDVEPAEARANVEAVLDDLDAQSPRPMVHVLIHSFESWAHAGTHPWPAYGIALAQTAAARDNVVFANVSEPFYDAGVPSADPFDLVRDDDLHLTEAGHGVLADLLLGHLGLLNLPTE